MRVSKDIPGQISITILKIASRLMKERNLNIEVLRCVLMMLITFGHCCGHGAFADEKSVLVAGATTTFSVNAFAFISGWYSVKLSFDRLLRFLGYGLFAFVVVNIVSFVNGSGFVPFTMGWYGNAYFVVMLLAPYINAGLDSIYERGGWRAAVKVVALYIGFMFVMWLPLKYWGINIKCGFGGHTAPLLIGVYLLARVSRLTNLIEKIRVKWAYLGVVVCEIILIGWSALGRIIGGPISHVKMWDYQSPVLILCAVFVFTIFYRARFPLLVQKLAKFCAPSMFMIYLLHDGQGGGGVISSIYSSLELILVNNYGVPTIISIVITTVIVFFVCLTIDMLRRLVLYTYDKNKSRER